MPVKRTSSGHKCGNSGKNYKGKGSKTKAAKQCKAIYANKGGAKRGKK